MSCYLSEANMICLLAGCNSVTGPQWGLTPHCRVDTKTPRTLLNTNHGPHPPPTEADDLTSQG